MVRCFDLVVVELSSSFCLSFFLLFRLFVRAFFDFRALAKYIKCERVMSHQKGNTRAVTTRARFGLLNNTVLCIKNYYYRPGDSSSYIVYKFENIGIFQPRVLRCAFETDDLRRIFRPL